MSEGRTLAQVLFVCRRDWMDATGVKRVWNETNDLGDGNEGLIRMKRGEKEKRLEGDRKLAYM